MRDRVVFFHFANTTRSEHNRCCVGLDARLLRRACYVARTVVPILVMTHQCLFIAIGVNLPRPGKLTILRIPVIITLKHRPIAELGVPWPPGNFCRAGAHFDLSRKDKKWKGW